MDIILYEKINRDKLREVLECNNIPFEDGDEEEWKQIQETKLKNYVKKKFSDKGIFTKYKQVAKYGRYYSSNGLQGFQREVKKYISGEFYKDIDIKNCHPEILEQLLEFNKISSGKLLRNYNNNREEFIKEYGFKNKLDFIKIINNDSLNNNKFKEIHDLVYENLVPKLKKENKTLYNRIKKERTKKKKTYNFEGSFLSHYLQNIENNILMVMFKFFNNKGFEVGVLSFDGLMIRKSKELTEELLVDLEGVILKETGYKLKLIYKSLVTKWEPNKLDKVELEEKQKGNVLKFSIEEYISLSDIYDIDDDGNKVVNEEKRSIFLDYSNNFMCLFENPHIYGWRDRTNEDFSMRSFAQIQNRTNIFGLKIWLESDKKRQFTRCLFKVEDYKEEEEYYNLYKRPSMKKGEVPEVFLDYLREVICNNDEKSFTYILDYLSILLKYGLTKQCIVLMGLMGAGKSSLIDICGFIVGKDYYTPVSNIHRVTNNFNSWTEKSILIGIEEIVSCGADYHTVQNILKTMITEETKVIEKKGVDSYTTTCYNNIIMATNGFNPVAISEDNRRYAIFEVNPIHMGDFKYFHNLKTQVKDNIESIREFLFNREITNMDLNSIRPTTAKEKVLLELNVSTIDRFIRDDLVVKGDSKHSSRNYTESYHKFKNYCHDNGEKVNISTKYYTQHLHKIGLTTERVTLNGRKVRIIRGNHRTEENIEEDIEED